MNSIKEVKDLPKAYQVLYKLFVKKIQNGDEKGARNLIRPILEVYTANDWEVPQEIEMRYAQLYVLELRRAKN